MNDSAGQFYRFELKYELTPNNAAFIIDELKKTGMKTDRHGSSDGTYFVSSLYFDSFDYFDYQEKAGGLLERKKIRARIYEQLLDKSEHVWLEIKRKHDSKVFKNRVKISRKEWDDFLEEGIPFLLRRKWAPEQAGGATKFIENFIRFSAKPKIQVCYRREAFVNESESLRMNFDTELEACRKSDLGYNAFMTPVNRGIVIMEVKFSYLLPHWVGQIIKKYNLKKEAVSKYGRSLEAINRHNPLPR